VDSDSELNGEAVLRVQYPEASGNPGARDVWCQTVRSDWSARNGIMFQVKPASTLRMSVSFRDGHGVAYTTWLNLEGGRWQRATIRFASLRPNPYFQPPGADTSKPLDVHAVRAIGLAPQTGAAGSFSIGRLTLF
jgi:hypothetical protein